jgi:replicative DNA helicase
MISRSLKQLAKELNIPIIALSQLNRSVESRTENKRPQLSDLRESGAIEQDADMVCFIHRPEYYLHSGQDAEGNDIRGLAQFIVAKHRSGAVDDVKMRFRAAFARFENWEDGASDGNTNSDTNSNNYTQRSSRLNGSDDAPQAASATGSQNAFSGGTADIIGTTNEEPPF